MSQGSFEHAVLGEMRADEYFWIFPKKVAFYLVAGVGIAFLLGKIFKWNAVGIVLASIVALGTLILSVMSVIKKNSKEYIKGGGISYLDLMERKVLRKSGKKLYSICAELPETKGDKA